MLRKHPFGRLPVASETELLRLAVKAYEAASEPELWPHFLKGYTEAVAADFSVLQIHDLGKHISTVVSGFGLAAPMKREYNEYYSKQNVWREWGRALFAPGRVNLDQEMCPPAVAQKSEFYNDCMLRMGGAYTFGAVFAREENRFPTLSAQRGRSKHRFGESERDVARFLIPHVNRAWIVHQRLGILAAGESVLDTLPLGIVFLSPDGAAVYCNSAAEEIFRAGDGLFLRNGRLSAEDRIADARLRRAVKDALSPGASAGPAAVPVPRTSFCRDYQVAASPLRKRFRQFTGTLEPVAVALITDPEKQTPASTDVLMQAYKLTRKEAMLAAKLFEGKSLEQAARELAITYETARTHLRRIFSKTRTSRQAELILLIARHPMMTGRNG
jgi:DNA-binding CsgD family transcriptional regulator/PAS domain-containing protein